MSGIGDNAPLERRVLVYNSSLVGANLERADLRGMNLRGVNLTNTNLRSADLTGADLRWATLIKADLSRANVTRAKFHYADLTDCDLTQAYGRATVFYGTRLWVAKLRRGTWKNAVFAYSDLTGADFVGSEFLGARWWECKLDGVKNANRAIYTWWYSPYGFGPAKMVYSPVPGYIRMDESVTGPFSFQENSARERVEDFTLKGWKSGKAE